LPFFLLLFILTIFSTSSLNAGGWIEDKNGKTIIVVTHDLNISKYGDRIIHLLDGKINKIEKVK